MSGPGKNGNHNGNKNGNDPNNNNKKNTIGFLSIILWAVFFVLIFNTCVSSVKSASTIEVTYSTFRQWVSEGYVDTVNMKTNSYEFTLKADAAPLNTITSDLSDQITDDQKQLLESVLGKNVDSSLKESVNFVTAPVANDTGLVELMDKEGVDYGTDLVSESSVILQMLASYVLPMVLMVVAMVFIYRYVFKKMGTGGFGGLGGVGKSNAKVYVEKSTGVTFRDVAGQDEAKESLEEIIDFLHNPGKYTEIGAKLPKGALLVGSPGTGKTLLAKAVAGEANVPFFSISGSDFVEMFVGVGASRVRDLFSEAAKMAPCIIFIDEIDTIGKSRDNRMGGNDEREQTLNQLLAELDGFDPTKGVIVLAATNRPEVLDKALLRPGRFDRRITVDRPNLAGRLATLQVHTRNIRLAEDVDLNKIAQATAGCVGADLANLVNEGALRAVRHGRKAVNQNDLLESFETVIAGSEKKGTVLTEQEKKLIAYHEVGHALVAAKQKNAQPVSKITIVPHTQGALGYTMQLPEEEKFLMNREELYTEIRTLLAGRSAEEVVFGTMTSGAANDIERATDLARKMVTMYGMSDKYGMMGLATIQNQYLDGAMGLTCAQDTAAGVDEEIHTIIDRCHEDAKKILTENRDMLDAIASYLLLKETITGGEMMAILAGKDPALAENYGASPDHDKALPTSGSPAPSGDEGQARHVHMVSQPVTPPAETPAGDSPAPADAPDGAPAPDAPTDPGQPGGGDPTPPAV